MPLRLTFCLALLGLFLSTPSTMQAQPTTAAWQQDLDALKHRLQAGHPDLYHTTSKADLDAAFAALEERLPDLATHEVVVEVARLLALVGDGHTFAMPGFDLLRPTTGFRKVPIRLAVFDEGLFVIRADSAHRDLPGARVLRVGRMDVDAAFEAAMPLVGRHPGNTSILDWQVPEMLVTAEVVQALGISATRDEVSYRLERADGTQASVSLVPVEIQRHPFNGQPARPAAPVSWENLREPEDGPLHLRHPEAPYWFTVLDDSNTVYVQFDQVRDAPDESFDAFCARLFTQVDRMASPRMIVDLRFNQGGDGTLNWALIQRLRDRPALSQQGRLAVLIGPQTFSAGMMAAVALERYTDAHFVGQPTGAAPNHFGDTGLFVLPATGLAGVHAMVYWQLSNPDDQRAALAPDIFIAPSMAAYRQGRDRALDAARDHLATLSP